MTIKVKKIMICNPPDGENFFVLIPYSKIWTKSKLRKEKYVIIPSHCEHITDLELVNLPKIHRKKNVALLNVRQSVLCVLRSINQYKTTIRLIGHLKRDGENFWKQKSLNVYCFT